MEGVPYGVLATLLGVAVAAVFGSLAFWLGKRKDRRDVEAHEPRFDIVLGRMDGAGPWPLHITVTNRDTGPIAVQRLDHDRGKRFQFDNGDDAFAVSFEGLGPQYRGKDWIDLNRRIEAGASHTFRAGLSSADGSRIPSGTQPVIVMTIGFSDRTARSKRFRLTCVESQ